MDIKRLRYFVTLVECGSFSKAAAVLNMSQPPLSQRIRELEDELGAVLVERKGRRFAVTPAGQVVYDKAREILYLMEQIPASVAKVLRDAPDTFRLGVSPTCLSHLSKFLPFIHLEYPKIYVRIAMGDSSHLENLLVQGEVDAALIQQPYAPDTRYNVTVMEPTELVAVVPREHFSDRTCLSMQELGGLPLALLKRTSGFGMFDVLIHAFRSSGAEPHVVMDSPEVHSIITFLRHNRHVGAILPLSELGSDVEREFRVMHIDKKDFYMHPSLIHLAEMDVPPVLARMKELVLHQPQRFQDIL